MTSVSFRPAAALGFVLLVLFVQIQDAEGGRVADRMRGQRIAAASPPLDDPELRPAARDAHMRNEDLVFGVIVEGRARAYPWWVAKNYHAVNDTIAGVPVAISFCEQCSGAAAFRRTLAGRVLSFEVAGVYNGTIILRDRQTRSLWAPFSGRAVEGPLADRTLERLPLSWTRWDVWTARHPASDVVWASEALRGGHGSWYEPGKWGIVSEMGDTLQAWDPRLPENALVHGVEDGGHAKAYPLARLRAAGGVLDDRLGHRPVVVVASGPLEVAAYERRVDGRELTFRPSRSLDGVMEDAETGTHWSGQGEALEGPLRGTRLPLLDGHLVEWHVWSAYHPGADLFRPASAVPATPDATATFPALTLSPIDGDPRPVTLTARVNLVILWAAWCPPCHEEMPRLQKLVEKHAAQGLGAVAIAIHLPDDDVEKRAARDFAERSRLTFPTFLVDEPAYDRLDALLRSLGESGVVLPTVLVTDARGRILAVQAGANVSALPGALEAALRGEPSGAGR